MWSWMLHKCTSVILFIGFVEALYVNDHPTHSQSTCRNPTILVRGQNLKVKYKSIKWIKGMFVYQWILKDVEALGPAEVSFTGYIACPLESHVFESCYFLCTLYICSHFFILKTVQSTALVQSVAPHKASNIPSSTSVSLLGWQTVHTPTHLFFVFFLFDLFNKLRLGFSVFWGFSFNLLPSQGWVTATLTGCLFHYNIQTKNCAEWNISVKNFFTCGYFKVRLCLVHNMTVTVHLLQK